MRDSANFPRPPDPLEGRSDLYGTDFDLDSPAPLDDLPVVEPPSAGFIVQLFLVPALIVTVVVGVYLLFGQLASGEQDWRKQLSDVRSDNPHKRWRGALGLAQMLQAGATSEGVPLAANRDVATELSSLLQESLARNSTSDDDLKHQEFLTRAVGLMDVPDVTFPVLLLALDPSEDREVRKNALASIAQTENRLQEQGRSTGDPTVVAAVIRATDDSEDLIRHLATFSLGLMDSGDARSRLEILLEHSDEITRVNAASALARQGSLAGLPVFAQVLEDRPDLAHPPSPGAAATDASDAGARFEGTLQISNSLQAIGDLSDRLDAESRERFIQLLTPLAESDANPTLRIEAQTLLTKLNSKL